LSDAFANSSRFCFSKASSMFSWSAKSVFNSYINIKLVQYSNIASIRDDPYWTPRKNSLELIELSSINKVSLV
jgi:hypothetical protein